MAKIKRIRRNRLRLLLLLAVVLTPATAVQAQVRVEVVSADDGRGVPSTIFRRVGDHVSSYATNPQGVREFAGLACAPNVSFKVRPLLSYYPTETPWTDCEANLRVAVPRAQYAALLEPAFTPGFGGEAAAAEDVRDLQTRLAVAAEAGDPAQVAAAASALSDRLAAVGQSETANLYQVIAIDSRYRALAGAAGEGVDVVPPLPDPTLHVQAGPLSVSQLLLSFRIGAAPLAPGHNMAQATEEEEAHEASQDASDDCC